VVDTEAKQTLASQLSAHRSVDLDDLTNPPAAAFYMWQYAIQNRGRA
jgi:hypothetical protein